MRRLLDAAFNVRRLLLIARIRIHAALQRATVDVQIAPGLRMEGRITLRIHPHTTTTIRIGKGTRLGDNLRLVLDGGNLVVGEKVYIRTGVVLHVRGNLTLGDQSLISYYSVLHCDEEITIGYRSALGEHLTIIDSIHVTPPEGEWWVNHIETRPVRLGEDIWGGSKITIGRGVTIDDRCVIAANSVVTGDVPRGSFAGGAPARVIGPASLWPGEQA